MVTAFSGQHNQKGYLMSATPIGGRSSVHEIPDARAGAVALLLLRFTLIGVALALVGTLGSVAMKVING